MSGADHRHSEEATIGMIGGDRATRTVTTGDPVHDPQVAPITVPRAGQDGAAFATVAGHLVTQVVETDSRIVAAHSATIPKIPLPGEKEFHFAC